MCNKYKTVNEMFDGLKLPPLSRNDACKIANRIFRKFGNKKFAANPARFRRPKCTPKSARRVWIDTKGVNDLNKGWRRLIHDTSHRLFSRRYPDKRPHDPLHSVLELEVAEYVVTEFIGPAVDKMKMQNFQQNMDAAVKDYKRVDAARKAQATRYAGVLKKIDQWERKQRRAETALKKLYKQRKYYEKKAG